MKKFAYPSPCNDVDNLSTPSNCDPAVSGQCKDKTDAAQNTQKYLPLGLVDDTDSSSSSESEDYQGISFDVENFRAEIHDEGR